MHGLTPEEEKAASAISCSLGEGVTSILYDEIRTKRGLAYEIGSKVRKENGIKLFTVTVSTARENTEKVIGLIDGILDGVTNGEAYSPDRNKLERTEAMLKIRRELLLEKSVQLAKELSTYELMYGSAEGVYSEFDGIGSLDADFVKRTAAKMLQNRSVQVMK